MKHITKVVPRIAEDYIIMLEFEHGIFPPKEEYQWLRPGNCGVRKKNFPKALHLATEITRSLHSKQFTLKSHKIKKMLAELKEFRVLFVHERTPIQDWDETAKTLVDDIGGPFKDHITRHVSEHLYGSVFEAMCGFNSYLYPHLDRIVTAHDYSEHMLMKYECPERERIQFDLNHLPDERLEFSERQFDNIFFVKGYKYIDSPTEVFKEWFRLLKPGGNLVFIESSMAAYQHLTKQDFIPNVCKNQLEIAGFRDTTFSLLPFLQHEKEELFYISTMKQC